MRGRVIELDRLVMSARKHFSVPYQDGAHRDFALSPAAFRFPQSHAHEADVAGVVCVLGREFWHLQAGLVLPFDLQVRFQTLNQRFKFGNFVPCGIEAVSQDSNMLFDRSYLAVFRI